MVTKAILTDEELHILLNALAEYKPMEHEENTVRYLRNYFTLKVTDAEPDQDDYDARAWQGASWGYGGY